MQIVLDHVSKKIGKDSLVENLTIRFKEKQTTAIIGPSGCGKSTLLRLILCLLQPSSGKITLDHEELQKETINHWRRQIGYVTQDGGLFSHLTARRNVTLMADYLRRDSNWIDQRINTLSELVQLPRQLLSQYPSELSGGQRQRVSLMRALFLDPKCILLDEPLGALDPITRYELQLELKQIFLSLQKTILLVTHDMQEAAFFGDEIVLMRDGKIVQIGPFSELVQKPIEPFVTEFIKVHHFPNQQGFNVQ